ncbi:polyprenol monophosphomannose synthase [Microbacterium sp. M3]|uniref:Polyprenol monophosphomannose synthase n=1 Tax=Microbacterium arthrosphaerae TaxID=792652 RepID=A0ABU4H229_9MICO|nr:MULTISPECIES: polyprenol monophosphomannose synthase [Microbacterium]MDW4573383.1 polyprenol monophosphomannose synthase [Microbacterium arthrosphaerae]MDW7607238.1 polyprenol monophosphomannose synthase [Microbacterium sp. M3]
MANLPEVTVVVPTFNESMNVAELVRRIADALEGTPSEVLFVDDSTDETPRVIEEVAALSPISVRLIHREKPVGGLGGAVLEGIKSARSDVCVVMDGDLQHPPEVIPLLLNSHTTTDADVVVASRYTGDGAADGLAGAVRMMVSKASTLATKSMFPLRLRNCSDPMTGFFLIDRRRIELQTLRPRGFKILLEILARQSLRVSEVPFRFAERHAGESKASLRQGVHFLTQLTALRFGKMSGFALIGALGAAANLAIMWGLTQAGVDYIAAAIVAAEVTIIGNFLLQERFIFREMIGQASTTRLRFLKSFTFNNAEAVIRIPILALLVETWHVSSVFAAGITLVAAFFARFFFHSLVVYAPRRSKTASADGVLMLPEERASQRSA